MTTKFKRVGIIGRYRDAGIADTLSRLADYLGSHRVEVALDAATADTLPQLDLPSLSRDEMCESCDLAIVVGGDGSMLNAARSLAAAGVPILGVNLGRLGFMVDVSAEHMEVTLESVLAGEYCEEKRCLLHADVLEGDTIVHSSNALNDVVIHKIDVARVIELETRINGRLLNHHRSDGLIIATPTGSTAYALSGGGPIMHPSLNAVVLVPICPHTLSYRPIAIGNESEIVVEIRESGSPEAQVTCDGQVNFLIQPQHRIRIRRQAEPLRLIHPAGYDYFHILREKLHWGGHH